MYKGSWDEITGADENIRIIQLKTDHGVVLKSTRCVFPLELSHINSSHSLYQLEIRNLFAMMAKDSLDLLTEGETTSYRIGFGHVFQMLKL